MTLADTDCPPQRPNPMTPLEPRFNEPANGRSPSGSSRRQGADEPIEVRRYVDAVRRGRWLILTLALSAALVAYILSSLAPDRFTATATIVKRVTSASAETVDVDSLARELSTIGQLLVTTDVLGGAAKQVGDGETATRLSRSVKSKVDPEANLIFISATARDPRKAPLELRYLLPSGQVITRTHVARAHSRLTIGVHDEALDLARTPVSTTLQSTNGVAVP